MSNEIQVRASLSIRNGNGDYQSRPTTFVMSQATGRGPSPGDLVVSTSGTNVDLSVVGYGGWVFMHNKDASNYVEFGIHDGAIFHPIGEIGPNEPALFRLSRNLGQEEDVPGTGTTGVVNALFLRAVGGTCIVRVEAHAK